MLPADLDPRGYLAITSWLELCNPETKLFSDFPEGGNDYFTIQSTEQTSFSTRRNINYYFWFRSVPFLTIPGFPASRYIYLCFAGAFKSAV